jgi:glycosyltransferase involved in cell wall biosynthesis
MVSVIIAAFDAESTIADSVRSLLRQSWGNLEVILVDDGGRDEGVARAHKVAEGDKRLRIIRMPTNSGAYVARNAGLAAATGRFVAFHDADDIAHPERIARQVAPLLVDGSLVATTARWIRCDDLARTRDRRILPAIRLHTGSVLVRRNFERAVLKGFDPVRFGADGDLLARLKLAAGAGRVLRIAAPLTLSRVSAGSAVHDPIIERLAYREARTRRMLSELLG